MQHHSSSRWMMEQRRQGGSGLGMLTRLWTLFLHGEGPACCPLSCALQHLHDSCRTQIVHAASQPYPCCVFTRCPGNPKAGKQPQRVAPRCGSAMLPFWVLWECVLVGVAATPLGA